MCVHSGFYSCRQCSFFLASIKTVGFWPVHDMGRNMAASGTKYIDLKDWRLYEEK